MTESTTVDADEAQRLRDLMTDKLVKDGWIASPAIEAAFRAVPRHVFTLRAVRWMPRTPTT
ncbi:MAG: hypothetical protein ACRDNW_05140 [Trebonia sp.]